eukprot:1065985-Alexandrium_andersonii.AAC.1
MHRSGASRSNFEADPWLPQCNLRTLEASSHVTHGGLRIACWAPLRCKDPSLLIPQWAPPPLGM